MTGEGLEEARTVDTCGHGDEAHEYSETEYRPGTMTHRRACKKCLCTHIWFSETMTLEKYRQVHDL